MSVRIKLIFFLTLILVGAFISLSLFNYNVTRKNVRNEIVNSSLPLTRDNIYSEIQAGLMRPIFVSSLMANDTFLKDWAENGEHGLEKIERYLTEIQNKYGFFSSFFVSASTGRYYYPGGVLKTVSTQDAHDVWYYDFVKSGEKYALDVDSNEAANNILTIFINHRLLDADGNLLGVTGVGLKMDNVSQLLDRFSKKFGKTIFLVDTKGLVQAHHQVEMIEKVNIRDMPGLGEIASQVLNTSGDPKTYEFKAGGDKLFLTARYIPELEWLLIVEQSENAALISAKSNFVRTLLIGAAATLLIVLLSVLTVNHYQLRLELQAETDELTGLANRRAFEKRVDSAFSAFARNSRPFALILLDLDGFKQVNDIYGHLEGDGVLKKIAEIVARSAGESDFCARWGGDEFILLADGDTDRGVALAENIREAVEQAGICNDLNGGSKGRDVSVTVSSGVAGYMVGDTLDSLTRRADQAMYASKKSGKNRVELGKRE
ncbi:sensor domain-containing diguanylate cyclase [Maridesulfovibrio sp.]|uniref:sensor domain-containing diguanylate cyclase n=1 Tax=Maridesulfovibrio sp. TaxID=2795000 RepID=UPI002A18A7E5|nr:sensor domain-containing diguanylate cyclase [Maridesulfovibrio sp.]